MNRIQFLSLTFLSSPKLLIFPVGSRSGTQTPRVHQCPMRSDAVLKADPVCDCTQFRLSPSPKGSFSLIGGPSAAPGIFLCLKLFTALFLCVSRTCVRLHQSHGCHVGFTAIQELLSLLPQAVTEASSLGSEYGYSRGLMKAHWREREGRGRRSSLSKTA